MTEATLDATAEAPILVEFAPRPGVRQVSRAIEPEEMARKSAQALDKAMSLATDEDEIVVLYVIPAALLEELSDMDPEVSKAKAREIVKQARGTSD